MKLRQFCNNMTKVLQAKSKVDDYPPKIGYPQLYKTKKLTDQAQRMFKIQKENKKLLQSINIINRTKGCVDCWRKVVKYDTISNHISRLITAIKIAKENILLHNRIKNAKSSYEASRLKREWENIRKYTEGSIQHPLIWKRKGGKSFEDESLQSSLKTESSVVKWKGISSSMKLKRPRCFMEFMADEESLGMIVAELYEDIVPLTVKNFIFFCQNGNIQKKRKLKKEDKEKNLTYTGCPVHRIVPNYYMQSGDVIAHNGSDGKSIYGPVFEDENFILKHSQPGVISMANHGPDTNNSQFMITFRKLETLNGMHVVFGRVIQGLDSLLKVEEFGTRTGRPRTKVIISKCGILHK